MMEFITCLICCHVKPKQGRIYIRCIYTKSVGLLHHLSHSQVSHYLYSQDKQCEHPHRIWFILSHHLRKTMPQPRIIPEVVSQLPSFDCRNRPFGHLLPSCEFGSQNQRSNTNQYICVLPIRTNGSAVCDCKGKKKKSNIVHFALKTP